MRLIKYSSPGVRRELERFSAETQGDVEVATVVREILASVKKQGDKAIVDYTRKLDGAKLRRDDLRVKSEELIAAAGSLSSGHRKAMRAAMDCIKGFHGHGFPVSWKGRNLQGAKVGERYIPLERIGMYIPGGNVPLVSTVFMTVLLARLARVPEIAVFTPPRADGSLDSGLLAALHMCRASEVYRVGGAQAVGAMAYGTRSIPPVHKIFGPGNVYVTEAKRQVFGKVGIDLLPGPSEVMVIADSRTRAGLVTADLLAQAEHGEGGKLYLVSTSLKLINTVSARLKEEAEKQRHRGIIESVLREGYLAVLVDNLDEAVTVANLVAPEHLELLLDRKKCGRLLKGIRNVGAVLIGEYTPTVLGDFTAGPSHTLPTGGTARFCSGLKLSDFFRRSSVVEYDTRSLAKARPVVKAFSSLEQLDAHGRSLEVRFGKEILSP